MLNSLSLLLIITLCYQHVTGRHLGQQSQYMPYTDYSYTYSGPGPLYPQHQHSPFFSPPGTYYDHRQGILRPFPGGGVPVLVDYHKRCSNQYVGLTAHPDQHQYYYVCKPDSVIFGKCQNLQIFNATCGQCVQHPAPEYKPTCATVGRFPLFSDCHLYYKCEEDLKPKIYSCPSSMIFSPISKKCTDGHKCTPTQISPHSSYIPEVCASKFPPCFENGIFRSPSDCSLYYKCDLKSNGVYMQTRLRCPQGDFYDLQKHECLPAKAVPCDCIQVAELVYPKLHSMAFHQPAVYPAPFELDSLEDGYYPVEQTQEDSSNNNDGVNDVDFPRSVTTTLDPSISETTLNNDDGEENETAVLSDYIDMRDEDNKSLSNESEALTSNPLGSEEKAGGIEADSNNEIEGTARSTTSMANTKLIDESGNLMEDTGSTATERPSLNGMTTSNLENAEITTVFKDFEQVEETTSGDSVSIRRREQEVTTASNELEQEEETTTELELETTTANKELLQEETTTTAKVATRSIKSQSCENVTEFDESNATDTHSKDTTLTQINKCFSKKDLQPKKDTIVSENTENFWSTLHAHNPTIIRTDTIIPKTTHLATTKITLASDNLVIARIPNETSLATNDNSLRSNLLESKVLSRETKPEKQETIRQLAGDVEKFTTTEDTMKSTLRPRSIEMLSIEADSSFEDILDADIIKSPKIHSTANGQSKKLLKERKANNATHSLHSSRIVLRSTHPKTEKTLQPETATIKILIDQAKPIKLDSMAQNGKQLSDEVGKNHHSLDSKKETINFETSAAATENPVAKDFNFTTSNPEFIFTKGNSVDYSAEEFIPVRNKTIVMNELTEETTDFENSFEDDYTTIISEKEFNTNVNATTIRGITQQQQTVKAVKSVKNETALRRRQASSATTIKPATQTTLTAVASAIVSEQATTTTVKTVQSSINKDFPEILDSDILIHSPSEAISNNQITSAETIETSSKLLKTQQVNQTPFRTSTPLQMTTVTTSRITTTETNEQQTDNLTVHVRKENQKQTSLDSSCPSQSLYYILETTPVIANNNNKFNSNNNKFNNNNNNNETVTAATPDIKVNNESIPRLEIIAERPIDVHLSICQPACDKNHTDNEVSTIGKRAVLLKWFANKSKQTMGFETANEIKTDKDY